MTTDIIVAISGAFATVAVGLLTFYGVKRSARTDTAATLLEERRLEVESLKADKHDLEAHEDEQDATIRELHRRLLEAAEMARKADEDHHQQLELLRLENAYLREQLGES